MDDTITDNIPDNAGWTKYLDNTESLIDLISEPKTQPKKPLTNKQKKSAIMAAIKAKQISKDQGFQLIKLLRIPNSTTKLISKKTKKTKNKLSKLAKKRNRKS